MKAVKIDVYWDHFKKGGIVTGQELMRVNEDILIVSGRIHMHTYNFIPIPELECVFFIMHNCFIIYSFS